MLNLQHNVVNILYTVKGMIEVHLSAHEERRFNSQEEALQHAHYVMKKIYNQANRALAITKRIGLAMKAKVQKEAPETGSDIREAWKYSIHVLSKKYPMQQIELIDHIPVEFPPVKCYKQDLIEIFYTLAQNAVQAMTKDGKLVIRANIQYNTDQPEAVITISDTGPGISQEVLSRLFDPFFTTKSESEGNGLGLCLVKGLVKNNGGKISVSSFAGCGTTFSISFQLAKIKVRDQSQVCAVAA